MANYQMYICGCINNIYNKGAAHRNISLNWYYLRKIRGKPVKK